MQVHRRIPIKVFSNFSHISGNLFINPGEERHCEEKGVPSPEKRKKTKYDTIYRSGLELSSLDPESSALGTKRTRLLFLINRYYPD